MTTTIRSEQPYRLRRSRIHGLGAFATQAIRKGQRIDEYVGERISHAEADRRHSKKDERDNHTFLFTLNSKIVLDATTGGNDSRYINHSCEPNCEVQIEKGRIFIYAAKAIEKGAEILYDYNIGRSKEDPPNQEEIFACRCGTASCRGTMLEPKKKPKAKAKAGAATKRASTPRRGGTTAARKERAAAKKASGTKAAKKAAGKTGATKTTPSPAKKAAPKKAAPKKAAPKKAAPKKAAPKKAGGTKAAAKKTSTARRSSSKR